MQGTNPDKNAPTLREALALADLPNRHERRKKIAIARRKRTRKAGLSKQDAIWSPAHIHALLSLEE